MGFGVAQTVVQRRILGPRVVSVSCNQPQCVQGSWPSSPENTSEHVTMQVFCTRLDSAAVHMFKLITQVAMIKTLCTKSWGMEGQACQHVPSPYSLATLLNAVPPLKTTRAGAPAFSDTGLNGELLDLAVSMGESPCPDAGSRGLKILGL